MDDDPSATECSDTVSSSPSTTSTTSLSLCDRLLGLSQIGVRIQGACDLFAVPGARVDTSSLSFENTPVNRTTRVSPFIPCHEVAPMKERAVDDDDVPSARRDASSRHVLSGRPSCPPLIPFSLAPPLPRLAICAMSNPPNEQRISLPPSPTPIPTRGHKALDAAWTERLADVCAGLRGRQTRAA